MNISPVAAWQKVKSLALRNRPSQKPQLWEDLGLALRRRVAFEVSHRLNPGWIDRGHVVDLSRVGLREGAAPLRMEVVPRELMHKSLFLYGALEISETRLVQTLLRPGMCFLDIGANSGYYALLAAHLVGPSGIVHAFEPNAAVRARLTNNIALNGFGNIVVHREAMTRQTGTVRFYKSAWSANDGISSIIPKYGLEEEGEDVAALCLDDFAARTLAGRPVDLLKIDIEGAEVEAFEGGRQFLGRADAPAILFEGANVEPLLEVLGRFGYHVRKVDYSLGVGIELPEPGDGKESIFASYEAPNYFAVKDPAEFARVAAAANSKRGPALQFLGRI
jgi:FkbM family methyltransferase